MMILRILLFKQNIDSNKFCCKQEKKPSSQKHLVETDLHKSQTRKPNCACGKMLPINSDKTNEHFKNLIFANIIKGDSWLRS